MRRNLAWAAALVVSLAGVGASVGAHAHHSMAMFDNQKKVTVSGTVKEFQWTNPHAYIQVVSTDSSGKNVEWSMEMGAPMYLYARGWRPTSVKAGQKISVTVHPLRNGDPGGVVLDVTDSAGKPIGKPA